MKNWKTTIRTLTIAILVLLQSTLAFAQEAPQTNSNQFIEGSDDISLYRCLTEGTLDFSDFIDGTFNIQFLKELFWEPYVDVLWRNSCHATDILRLIDQYNAIRYQIRDAYISCETAAVGDLRLAYNKVRMELYFVRHLIDGGEEWPSEIALSAPFNLLSTRDRDQADQLLFPLEKLRSNMVPKFVDTGMFDLTEFNRQFNLLAAKYAERKYDYVYCENTSWEDVAEKWDEFIETAGGITPAWENLEESVAGRSRSIYNRLTNIAESLDDMTFSGFVTGIAQVNVNGLDVVEGFNEIVDFVSATLPEGSRPTRGEILQAVTSSTAIYDSNRLRAEIQSEFEALYLTASDAALAEVVDELSEMNQILEESLLRLDEVEGCADVVNERQCSSKI